MPQVIIGYTLYNSATRSWKTPSNWWSNKGRHKARIFKTEEAARRAVGSTITPEYQAYNTMVESLRQSARANGTPFSYPAMFEGARYAPNTEHAVITPVYIEEGSQ
jgi:hypothetical protein